MTSLERPRGPIALVGEVYVDVTLTPEGQETKVRLGGIVHAARGLWAAEVPYEVGAFAPDYMSETLPHFLEAHNCEEFRRLGCVHGAPNVILIADQAEVGDQGYETLLRDHKTVSVDTDDYAWAAARDVLIFPGTYDWKKLVRALPADAQIHIDFAYDVYAISELEEIGRKLKTLFISTSSQIFASMRPCDRNKLVSALEQVDYDHLIIKENRGGSAVYEKATGRFTNIPAKLADDTVNSVGVGDVYDAIYVARLFEGSTVAAGRAGRAAAAYAQTTFPDVLKKLMARALRAEKTTLAEGTVLPWDRRPNLPIYLAAPDFERHPSRAIIEAAVRALEYHNFKVLRPVLINGELERPASVPAMRRTYALDKTLLAESAAVMAIPLDRDPGTLVEVGLALEAGIPVIVFDPNHEAENTMVVGGCAGYSKSFGVCLNDLFRTLSDK